MNVKSFLKYSSISAAAAFLFSVSAPAQAPQMVLLNGLQKGSWTLKERGSSDASTNICLGDARRLLQIEHGNVQCTRYIIEDTPTNLRVSYKCGSLGHGVTNIRRESSNLVQIQTQGIANKAPFSIAFEGRRTGSC